MVSFADFQERGFFSKAHSTWGLNLKNEPYRRTLRPDDLYKTKENFLKQQEIVAKQQAEGKRVWLAVPGVLFTRLPQCWPLKCEVVLK